jgi:hypothetical protein
MPYIYPNVLSLEKQPKVGDQECVTLVRTYTSAPHTSAWKQGKPVIGNRNIALGTAIATFEHGRYPSRPDHKHSAFYIGQTSTGIWVMDQWPGKLKDKISKRFIGRKEIYDDGTYDRPSDNCFAFFVIE